MKNIVQILTFSICSIIYSQEYKVTKTEVLIDYNKNEWSQTTENVFLESITLIPGGSLEIAIPGKKHILIYKLEITNKIDKDGNQIMIFEPDLIRGRDSEIEITFINNKPIFAYGKSIGWDVNNPNKIEIFRLFF